MASLIRVKPSFESFSPIARLPPELLTAIFLLHLESTCSGVLNAEALIPSHVCQHWRQVAVDCAQLWSTIELGTNPKKNLDLSASFWQESILGRSRNLPLSIHLCIRTSQSTRRSAGCASTIIAELMPRVKNLGVSGQYAHQFLGHLPNHAPILESLTTGEGVYCVSDVFASGAPRLRRLSLAARVFGMGVFPAAPSSILHGGTISELKLEVEFLEWDPFHHGAQGLTQSLRTLSVDVSGILFCDNPHPPVEFAQLNTLSIRGYDPFVFQLLQSIRVPSTTQVEVAVWDEPGSYLLQSVGFDQAFKAISECRSVDLEPRCLVLSRGETYDDSTATTVFRLRAWVDRPSSCPPHMPSEACLVSVASITRDKRDKIWDHPGPPFSISAQDGSLPLPGMSLTQLESMYLQPTQGTGCIPLANGFWDDLSRLPSLSALSVRTYDMSSLLKQLEEDSMAIERAISNDPRVAPSMPPLRSSSSPGNLPSLESDRPDPRRRFQALENLCFDGRGFDSKYSWCDFGSKSFFETLEKNIRLRHRLGPESALGLLSFLEWECVPAGWSKEFPRFALDVEGYGVTLRTEPEHRLVRATGSTESLALLLPYLRSQSRTI